MEGNDGFVGRSFRSTSGLSHAVVGNGDVGWVSEEEEEKMPIIFYFYLYLLCFVFLLFI